MLQYSWKHAEMCVSVCEIRDFLKIVKDDIGESERKILTERKKERSSASRMLILLL